MSFREGQTATNPKTGQQLVFKGGQWVSASANGSGKAPPSRAASLDALSRQLEMTRGLYKKNFEGVGLRSIGEYLPTPTAGEFNSAAAGLSDQALSAFRVPGVGSQSDRELASFVAANQPSNWDTDKAVEQKLRNIEGRLVAQRRAAGLPDIAPPLNPAKRLRYNPETGEIE